MPTITTSEGERRTSVPLRAPERACLALGALCRRLFRFQQPEDLQAATYFSAYFDAERRQGRVFLDKFPEKPNITGAVVLEVGCGFGGMACAFSELGCARVIGIDTDSARVSFAKERLQDVRNVAISVADAAALPLPDESVDIIVSDAVVEHIGDLSAALREMKRVLRPGGRLYADWGPAWLSYNGPHLLKCIGVPWVQLMFSDRTILNVLYHLREHGPHPTSYIDYKIEDFRKMGRNTRRKFRAAAVQAGLAVVTEESRSPRPWKQRLTAMPLLDELLAGELVAVLERRAR